MPVFRSAHEALTFAFNYNGSNTVSVHMGDVPPPAGNGRGLGGLDGAAEAGNVKRIVREFGAVTEALAIARFAPPRVPCSCHRPCCSGWTPNNEWRQAVRLLSQEVMKECFNFAGDVVYRFEIVSQYFLKEAERKPIELIASSIHLHKATAYRHFKAVRDYFRGTRTNEGVEQIALNLIDERLRAIGVVGELEE